MVAVFALGPIFGLPLIRRYIATPAVLLCLFYGLAVAGWALLPPGRDAPRLAGAGVVAALLSVAYLPWHADMLAHRRAPHRARRRASTATCSGPTQAPAVRGRVRRAARDLTAGDHRPIPYARFWLGGAPGTVGTVEGGASPMGELLLMPGQGPDDAAHLPAEGLPEVATPAGWRDDLREPLVARVAPRRSCA